MNFDIFHAYDVRGTYPIEIDEGICYEITLGYISLFKPKNVVVGMDARLSSPPLKESVIKALIDSGINALDVDRVTTDMIYFAVGHYDYSGGIIISASHNPRQYNGMKFVREKATAISSDTGLFDIRDALREGRVRKFTPQKVGTLHKFDIFEDYVKHVLSFVDRLSIEKFRFVGNGNFGFIGKPLYRIVDELGLTMIPINLEPDGSFPKGAPDPLLPENRLETEDLIKKSNVDFGVPWDADADRVMFFDENGRYIQGVYITALLAKIMLEKFGGNNRIIFDTRVIWPILKVVNEMEGTPIISKAGHAFMKDRMRSEDALFAGELSAHYYFRDNYYADNGIIPFLLILEYLSKSKKKFSKIVDPFMQGHYMSGEFNYTVRNIEEILEKVRQHYKDYGREDYIDGYSLESKMWRFNIRPSNTQPLLRLNVEAKENHLLEKIKNEIEEIIYR